MTTEYATGARRSDGALYAGDAIRSARHLAGISQRELARRSGVNHTWLSKIENGRLGTIPSAGTIVAIANALDVDSDWLQVHCGRLPDHLQTQILNALRQAMPTPAAKCDVDRSLGEELRGTVLRAIAGNNL